jgi:hypothetical protein
MPKPPVETIDPKGRTLGKVSQDNNSNRDNKRFLLDFIMALVIFINTIIELISWRLQNISRPAKILDYGDGYLVYTYPLLTQITIFVFALFFLVKIIRYKSCIWTNIVTLLYFSIQTINLLSIIFKIGMPLYEELVYPLILSTVIILSSLKLIRCHLVK